MSPTVEAAERTTNPFVDLLEALANHHGQFDIRLDHLSMKFPFGGSVEVNGTMSLSVHLRELTEKEKGAHVARQLRQLSA